MVDQEFCSLLSHLILSQQDWIWCVFSSSRFRFYQSGLPNTGNTWYRSQRPTLARWS